MANHRDLTGADLHEPKGVDSASANLVYASDGAGSGSWKKVTIDMIDPSTLPDVNHTIISTPLGEVSSAPSVLLPIPAAGKVISAVVVFDAILTGTDLTLTFTKTGGLSLGSPLVIPTAGSGEGTTATFTVTINGDLVPNDYLRVAASSGTTGSAKAYVTFLIEKG